MTEKILDAPGTVTAAGGFVVIDGPGHPQATYTPDAAVALAFRLEIAAREAITPSPAYIAADVAASGQSPSPA